MSQKGMLTRRKARLGRASLNSLKFLRVILSPSR